MNKRDPKFWALIGFGVGAVSASAGSISNPLDSLLGGLIQASLWFLVSLFIIKRKQKKEGNNVKSESNSEKLKQETFLLFDKPVFKDWLFYVFLFSLFSNVVGGINNVSNSGGLTTTGFGAVSGVGDAIFRVLLSWFPLIPIIYAIRRLIRKKKYSS